MIKPALLALATAVLFSSCAGSYVEKTYVATGAANPKSIYVRPFDVTYTEFKGRHRGGPGERPIRRSLAGREFAEILKEEVEKIAPAMVLEANEFPKTGWIIEGELDVVHAGSPAVRALTGPFGFGQSRVQIHVRIIDVAALGSASVVSKDKGDAEMVSTQTSSDGVIYAFTLDGGSGATGAHGSVVASGLGESVPFDYRNAAERIYIALSRDPFRYGLRNSPTYRY